MTPQINPFPYLRLGGAGINWSGRGESGELGQISVFGWFNFFLRQFRAKEGRVNTHAPPPPRAKTEIADGRREHTFTREVSKVWECEKRKEGIRG